MKENLQMENWFLHFDGKHIEENEYQVVVLKNERTEVKLDALRLKNGKADTIAQAITKVIDKYNLWNAIKIITADTTSVNTGKKNGVVIQLQQRFLNKVRCKPQFISCQHHVLDRMLRLVLDEENSVGSNSSSPNIQYPFVSQLIKNYEELKVQFVNGTEVILDKSR